MKPISLRSRSTTLIAAEWDKLAAIRARQVKSGSDHSALEVLAPAVIALMGTTGSVVDIGCGTGWLSDMLSDYAQQVVGVDASRVSIKLARSTACSRNVRYVHSSIESFAKSYSLSFSAAVANMTLCTAIKLPRMLAAIHRCLKHNGIFVFTIPHPCFWPIYWGYADAPWFKYDAEIAIVAPFRIASEGTALSTTHIHRPLQQYVDVLETTGFELQRFSELTGRGFPRPRFIAMRWQKRS